MRERAEREETSTCLFWGWDWSQHLRAAPPLWLMSGGSSPPSLQTPSRFHSKPSRSHSLFFLFFFSSFSFSPLFLFPSPVCPPRALEAEWSECEPPIVEINGIWSTAYKEWQSLDSKWAKRVVRTWAALVVRKGWRKREREMEWWRRGRRPLAVCSTTKCWIMRSDWHDPAPELRETVLPHSPSIFWSYCLCLSPTFSLLVRPKSHVSPLNSIFWVRECVRTEKHAVYRDEVQSGWRCTDSTNDRRLT